tara:strand:- start:17 stop:937 length:921 start_codon:yes stop_codon:yes gene_type:complete
MKKILVLATGWHFSSHFYENMPKQILPKGWKAEYVCVAHRLPTDENTIKEKKEISKVDEEGFPIPNFLVQLDELMYEHTLTEEQIQEYGWKFMLEENTIGDMEVFNQWSKKNDYREYDIICITHDDNFILSEKIFYDILDENTKMYKPIVDSRYGANGHQFEIELIDNDNEWYFLDNGYTEDIPKAFTPRGSFSFYKKELIDLLPDNEFNMYEEGGLGVVERVGETHSVGHMGIAAWNTHAGTFRDFLYNTLPDLELVDRTRWLSNTKRVSEYCIEGERGFVSNHKADQDAYVEAIVSRLEKLGWL